MKTTRLLLLLLSWLPCAAAEPRADLALVWPASALSHFEPAASLTSDGAWLAETKLTQPAESSAGTVAYASPAADGLAAWERWLADAGQYSVHVGDLRLVNARREAVPEGPVPFVAAVALGALVVARLWRRGGPGELLSRARAIPAAGRRG